MVLIKLIPNESKSKTKAATPVMNNSAIAVGNLEKTLAKINKSDNDPRNNAVVIKLKSATLKYN